jgi:uncharacterized protein YjbI with pentapeptide repeats
MQRIRPIVTGLARPFRWAGASAWRLSAGPRKRAGQVHPRNFVLLLSLVIAIPLLGWLVWVYPQDQANIAQDENPNLSPEARIALINEIRRTWATIAAGFFVFLSGYLAWRNVSVAERNLQVAQRNLTVNQEGQITERFTRAIEQLGATDDAGKPRIEIRLGGIYALERIAQDSPERDHGPIMEVLTAYVRENAKFEESTDENGGSPASRVSTDVQAILTVLGRRSAAQRDFEKAPLDLSSTNLSGANLSGANLSRGNLWGAYLSGANLFEANLFGADLRTANLSWATLSGANFDGANLSGGNLWGSKLQRADLGGANLSEADLSGANVSEADLSGANLSETDLSGANLSEADLGGTNLSGVGLRFVKNLTKEQIARAITDNATRLPDYLMEP